MTFRSEIKKKNLRKSEFFFSMGRLILDLSMRSNKTTIIPKAQHPQLGRDFFLSLIQYSSPLSLSHSLLMNETTIAIIMIGVLLIFLLLVALMRFKCKPRPSTATTTTSAAAAAGHVQGMDEETALLRQQLLQALSHATVQPRQTRYSSSHNGVMIVSRQHPIQVSNDNNERTEAVVVGVEAREQRRAVLGIPLASSRHPPLLVVGEGRVDPRSPLHADGYDQQ